MFSSKTRTIVRELLVLRVVPRDVLKSIVLIGRATHVGIMLIKVRLDSIRLILYLLRCLHVVYVLR